MSTFDERFYKTTVFFSVLIVALLILNLSNNYKKGTESDRLKVNKVEIESKRSTTTKKPKLICVLPSNMTKCAGTSN